MNFWDILGIAVTDDVSSIKRAYAKELKTHHPEDDPEGYQQLREAYDSATKYAKRSKAAKKNNIAQHNAEISNNELDKIKNNSHVPPKIDILNDFLDETNDDKNSNYTHPHVQIFQDYFESSDNSEQQLNDFYSQLQALYGDFFSRIEIKNWETLLDSDIMWKLNLRKQLLDIMIEFLMKNHQLPHSIWVLIDKSFDLNRQKDELYIRYPKKSITSILRNINEPAKLNFCYFKKLDDVDYNAFLDFREKAFIALRDKEIDLSKNFLDKSYEIYKGDPDLLRMLGEYYIYKHDANSAICYLNHAIEINSTDYDARYFRAKLYDKMNDRRAIEDFNYISAYFMDDLPTIRYIGKSYFKFNELSKSKKLFIEVLNLAPKDVEAKNNLRKILNKLNLEIIKKPKDIKLKNELSEVYTALGIPKFHQCLAALVRPSFKKYASLLIIILIILFSIINISLKSDGLNMSFKNVYSYINNTKDISTIKKPQDIMKLPERNAVSVNITEAEWMCVYQLTIKDDNNKVKEIKYVTSDELDSKHLNDYISGYVYTGKLGDKKIIFIVDYDETGTIDKTNTYKF